MNENENLDPENKESLEPKEEFVPKKAFEEVSKDLHKFKKAAKEAEALANQLQAERELAETAAKEQQGLYKELYHEKEKVIADFLAKEAEKKEAEILLLIQTRVTSHVGGWKNPAYIKFIEVSNISRDPETGMPLESDMLKEADRIKQTLPELLAVQVATRMPTGAAQPINLERDLSKMSSRELDELMAEAIRAEKAKK